MLSSTPGIAAIAMSLWGQSRQTAVEDEAILPDILHDNVASGHQKVLCTRELIIRNDHRIYNISQQRKVTDEKHLPTTQKGKRMSAAREKIPIGEEDTIN